MQAGGCYVFSLRIALIMDEAAIVARTACLNRPTPGGLQHSRQSENAVRN
jgi:hypothetical protein